MQELITPPDATQQDSPLKQFISSKIYLASLYFITVGVLFLWGYWPTFGINILEFLDLADILKVTAYPIAVLVLTSGAGAAIAHLASPPPEPTNSRQGQPSNRSIANHPTRRFLYPAFDFLDSYPKTLKVIFVLALAILFLGDWRYSWAVIPGTLSIPLALLLADQKIVCDTFKNSRVRSMMSLLIPVICIGAYGLGKIQSANVINGHAYIYATSEIKGHPFKSVDFALRYIGHAGDHIFFFNPTDKTTLIVKLEDDTPLALKILRTKMASVLQSTTSKKGRIDRELFLMAKGPILYTYAN